MWQIRAREADYPIPLTTAIAFPGWANNIGYVLYNALDRVFDPIDSDSLLETVQASLTDNMGTCSKKETHGRHCPMLADLFMPRTYSATSRVIATVSFFVHSVSFSSTPATCTSLRKRLKGAHGVVGGQCLLILSSMYPELNSGNYGVNECRRDFLRPPNEAVINQRKNPYKSRKLAGTPNPRRGGPRTGTWGALEAHTSHKRFPITHC